MLLSIHKFQTVRAQSSHRDWTPLGNFCSPNSLFFVLSPRKNFHLRHWWPWLIWHISDAALIGLVTLTFDLLTSSWWPWLHAVRASFVPVQGFVRFLFLHFDAGTGQTDRHHNRRINCPRCMASLWRVTFAFAQFATRAVSYWCIFYTSATNCLRFLLPLRPLNIGLVSAWQRA